MSNFHERIMNIPDGAVMSKFVNESDLQHYKYGHRDARHAAAEVANEADETIEELYKALKYAANCLDTDGNDPVIDQALAKFRDTHIRG